MRFLETNSSLEYLLFKPDSLSLASWKIVLLVICSIVIIFTSAGNLLTLVAALNMKQFHNSVSNLYIASLAAADLIVGSFVVTFRVLYTVVYDLQWEFGDWLCNVWQILDFTCCAISLYSICAIAFDRWFNLQKPLRIFKRSRKFARKSIIVIWFLPIIITVTAFSTIGEKTPNTGQCCFTWRSIKLVPLFVIPIFYVPVILLVVVFLRIAYVIRNHLHFLQKHANSDANRRLSRRLSRIGNESTVLLPASPNPTSKTPPHKTSSPCILFNSELAVSALPETAAISHLVNTPIVQSRCEEPSNPAPCRSSKRLSESQAGPDTLIDDIDVSLSGGKNRIDKNLHTTAANGRPVFSIDSANTSPTGNDPLPMSNYRRKRKISRQQSIVSPQHLASAGRRQPAPLLRAKTEAALLSRRSLNRIQRMESEVAPQFASASRKFSSNLFSEIIPNATMGIAQQVRAARAVGMIMICFLLCWIPFIVIWPMKITCPECVSDRIYDAAIWANYLNSTINPILYALCSPRFQVAIRRFMCVDHKPLRSFYSPRGKSITKL